MIASFRFEAGGSPWPCYSLQRAGLFFLPFIFLPILGFGEATYRGPSVGSAAVR